MSVGYSPTNPPPFDSSALTDEDQQRIAAMMAQPAPSALPAPPPVAPQPPPAPAAPPQGLDSIDSGAIASKIAAAGTPPAPPSPGPTTVPGPSPASPPAAAPSAPPETPKQADELRAADEEAEKARQATNKATIDLQKAGQPAVDERARLAAQQVEQQKESIRQQQEINRRFQAADDAANQQIAQTHAAIKNFTFRDRFQNEDGSTKWGLKIASALAAGLGAFGAGLTHGPNYALQILNKDMDDFHQSQVDHLNQLKDEEVSERTGIANSQLARQKALADLTVADAARDELISRQLKQAAAQQSAAEFAPSLTLAAAKLDQEAAEKKAAAKKALVELNLKLQDEQRKAHLDTASIDEKEALTKLHNVQAANGGFARVARGTHGAGGGGASPAQNAAANTLSDMIAQGKPYSDLVAKANELHYPLEAKAGHPSLKTLIAGAGAAARPNLMEHRQEEKDANDWAAANGLKPIEKSQRELGSLLKEMKDNAGNPLQQALAVEKAVSAARGGAASKQALSLALEHMGGSLSNAESFVAHIKDGTLGEKKLDNFMGFLNGQMGAAQAEGKEKYDAYNKYIESQPEAKRQGLLAQRGRLFSGLSGFGGGGGGVDEGKVARAKAAIAPGSTATPAQRTNAEAYLRQVGRL